MTGENLLPRTWPGGVPGVAMTETAPADLTHWRWPRTASVSDSLRPGMPHGKYVFYPQIYTRFIPKLEFHIQMAVNS